ncbi:MAG: hypothetical protein R3F34_09145 [Planctomycetota bacterium]
MIKRYLPIAIVVVAAFLSWFFVLRHVTVDFESESEPSFGTFPTREGDATSLDDSQALAASAPEPASIPASAPEGSRSERRAIADPDTLRWSDVVRAVDADGATIEDAFVWYIDAKGDRTRNSIHGVVTREMLDTEALVALDSDRHCPRFVHASSLVDRVGDPVELALHRSLAIELVPRVGDTLVVPVQRGRIAPLDVEVAVAALDPELEARRSLTDNAQQPLFGNSPAENLYGSGSSLRGLLDDEHDEKWRGRQVRRYLRVESAAPYFTVEGSQILGTYAIVDLPEGVTLPIVVDDLPVGIDYELIFRRSTEDPYFAVLSEFGTPSAPSISLVIDGTEGLRDRITVAVDRVKSARVVGTFPKATSYGFVELSSPGVSTALTGTRRYVDRGGPFEVLTLPPYRHLFTAQWGDEAGAECRYARFVDLVAGETLDVGQLAVATTPAVRFVPVFVGGENVDERVLAELRATMSWSLDLLEARRDARPGGFDLHADAFQPIALDGLEPGSYVARAFAGTIDFGLRSRFDIPEEPVFVEFEVGAAPIEVELPFQLTAERAFEVRAVSTPYEPKNVRVVAERVGDGKSATMKLRESKLHPGEWSKSHQLLPGTWTFVVVGEARAADSESTGCVATGKVDVEVDDAGLFEFRLQPAAAVEGSYEFLGPMPNGSRITKVHPVGSSGRFTLLWTEACRPGETVRIENLLPNTEYVVFGTDRTFTTGAGGTTTRVD